MPCDDAIPACNILALYAPSVSAPTPCTPANGFVTDVMFALGNDVTNVVIEFAGIAHVPDCVAKQNNCAV